MTSTARLLVLLAAAAVAAPASANEVLWNQGIDGQSLVPSHVQASPPEELESADDFDLVGTIERVVVGGHLSFTQTQAVDGFRVRFYAWTAGGPGALLHETQLAAGDPRLVFDPANPQTFDVTLVQPFPATGKHFVSFQILSPSWAAWRVWTSHSGAPTGSAVVSRDVGAGGAWGPYSNVLGALNADLAFTLWGEDATPPAPSTDPCGTWIPQQPPMPVGTNHSVLRDVVAIASDDVWAVGTPIVGGVVTGSSRTHAVRWDGVQWSIVPTPQPEPFPGAGVGLEAVGASGPNDVWAAGTQKKQDALGFLGSQLLVMRWQGAGWQVLDTPVTDLGYSGAFARGVAALAPDDVWFVGDFPGNSGQESLQMHWNGTSFQQHHVADPLPGPVGLEAVSALSSSDIWAVGGGGDGDWSGYSYVIHYDGSQWSYVPGPTPGIYQRLFDVEAISPDDVWAVGEYGDVTGLHPLFIHWDGAGWTQVPAPATAHALHAFGPDDVYAAGQVILRWDGAAWSVVEDFHQESGVTFAALDGAGPCEVVGVGRHYGVPSIASFAAQVESSPITHYCAANPNSTGAPALMDSQGSASVAANDLILRAVQCPPSQIGAFFYGASQAQAPFGDGYRCIGAPVHRLQVAPTSAAGTASFALDVQTAPAGAIVSGSHWNFQFWYRDPAGGATGVNMTDGLSVTFEP